LCIATDKEVGASDRRRREMRPGRVYMMEFKVIFVIGIVVERIMDGNS
jgi:hypothetical protein